MKRIKILFVFLLISFSLDAQISGVVKDSLTGEPIPYVNIWVENENIGTNSEIDGKFSLNASKLQKIVFSALGFESKTVSVDQTQIVMLVPKVYELPEIILEKRKITSQISIGDFSGIKLNSGVSNIGQDDVHIWGKFIKINDKIKLHPYLKSMEFVTRSKVKNALLRIRIFAVDAQGNPIGDLVEEEILVSVKKGKNANKVDITKYSIKVPEEGIIIGFEYLKLLQNKHEYVSIVQGEKGRRKIMTYEPTILGFYSDQSRLLSLNRDGSFRSMYTNPEIALKLDFTN